jgi:hypothetical protein
LVKVVDDRSGFKFINHYMIMSELGRGVHGKVKLARMENGNLVVRSFPLIPMDHDVRETRQRQFNLGPPGH